MSFTNDLPEKGWIYIPRFKTIISPEAFRDFITSLDLEDEYYVLLNGPLFSPPRKVGERYERTDLF